LRILITGAGGQLGRDLQQALDAHDLLPLTRQQLDITNAGSVHAAIGAFAPEVLVHAAALTDTSRCEREPVVAYEVNATGAANVARACAMARATMVYVSTNEVFDGTKREPYFEDDAARAVNAYGRSKLEGERLVRGAVASHYIVRTAWLYGAGSSNFPQKVLLAAASGALTGVMDETATPTYTQDLARAISVLLGTGAFGVYHFTNVGEASRYEWMREILRLAGRDDVEVRPVTTAEFRASLEPDAIVPKKPPYSVLANTRGAALGIRLRPWQEALAEYLKASGPSN
jgi:dTDP-4-dehydrorhamnose reductase